MRPIKFRGKAKGGYFDGKIIYGYFSEKFNDDGELVPVIIWDTENPAYFSEVYPESVAQLVGYDADGNEIYDKDEVIDIEDGEMPWGGNPRLAVVDEDCNFLGDIGDSFEDVKLKES